MLARSVVAGVETRVVNGTIDRNPVGLVDAAAVAAGRAIGKGTRHLDPAALFPYDRTHLVGHFGKVLILAEHHSLAA